MPRSFKISFPLPRRSSSSPNITPGSQYSSQSTCDNSPLFHPGSKAERTLGAAEPEILEIRKKQSRKQKKQLRKNSSFMSVTLSNVDGEPVQGSDGFPFPGMQTPRENPGRGKALNRKASSPLLGELYLDDSTNGDNTSFYTAPHARRMDSSSSLRSHYDSAKVPLPISQQTSESSARDMALRKGFPTISGPTNFERIGGFEASKNKASHSRNVSGDSRISAEGKLSGNSLKRIQETPRRRPSVTDPPTLHPDQTRTFHAVSPPLALINSSVPTELHPSSLQTRPRWWQKKTFSPKASPPLPIDQAQDKEQVEDITHSIKVNVKKPKPGIDGARNWFDGVEDEDLSSEDIQNSTPLASSLNEKPKQPLSIYEIMSQERRPYHVTQRKSSLSNKSRRTATPDRKLSFRLDNDSLQFPNISSVPPNESQITPRSPEAKSVGSTPSSKGIRTGVNLQTDSFLELSSSEDEGRESSAPSEAQETFRRHRIRASIEQVSYNNEVSVSNAQSAQPVRPRSIVSRNSSRPLSKRSTSSEIVPPVPRIPDKAQFGQRSSSTRWREIMEERALSTESTVDSGASSLTDNGNIRKPRSSRTKRKPSLRGSRLMKVSSEEERLLEAMRDKRASIRQDDFEKGFRSAMQLQDIVVRPKTAGADGRTSRSSFYGSRSSRSSILPDQESKRTMIGSRISASVDDLCLEDAYPFPDVPSQETSFMGKGALPELKSPIGFVSPPKASPSLSFGTSEIHPSDSNSPLTPPPGLMNPGAYDRINKLSPSRGANLLNKPGHDRTRTGSSSIVMLDSVDHHAQEMDEDDELRQYMARW